MVLPSLFSLPMPLYTSWGFCWDWPESWDPSGPQAAPIDSLRSLRVPGSLHADALPLASRPQVRDVKPAGGPCQLPPRLPRFRHGMSGPAALCLPVTFTGWAPSAFAAHPDVCWHPHSKSAPGFTHPAAAISGQCSDCWQFLLRCWEESLPIVEFLALSPDATGCKDPGHSGNFSLNRRIKRSIGGLRLSDRTRRSKRRKGNG